MESSSTSRFKLWSELVLEEYTEKFVIKSVESPDQGFSISRLDGNIDKLNSTYVLVITSRKEVGTYLGFPVFLVTSMKFLSCNGTSGFLTSQEKRDEDYYMTLLKIVESTPGLYFSYGTDITLKQVFNVGSCSSVYILLFFEKADVVTSLQRRRKLATGWESKPIGSRSAVTFNSFNFIFSLEIDAVKLNSSGELQGDPRFVWNRNLLEELIENKLDGFIIPLLQGNILTSLFSLPNPSTLPSPSCPSGTRMWRRGANLGGDTANFIETEQLLDIEGHISSFLQVRGSIPLLWEQIVDLSYKPRLNIIHHEQTSEVVERHFNDILQRYGGCIAVDLTDKHGDEGLLSMAYAEEMQKLVQKLPNLNRYFLLDPEGKVLAEQEGVVRSNCIDCLDRTNVTQDAIDLISGRYTVNRNGPSPSQPRGFDTLSYLPVASALLVGGLTVTSITLNQAGRQAHQYLSSVICAGLTAGVMAVIKANGRQICSRPRLCGLL
ncbi:UNVERIFIED_CONTAM: Phosphoinositide phosphatase SAC8 [Sesamum radiatum]|uniref:Phosphoinositide phosphatase SAC8 n=1 Tax=Sesamum radiatum TaxID=300843 RepID=A0AAW2KST9_SESRA